MTLELVDNKDVLVNHDAVLDQIKNVNVSVDKGKWELAQLLYSVHDEMLYGYWGYDSFDSFVESEITAFGVRTARYLVSVYKFFFKQLSLSKESEEKLKGIGWSKAKTLIGHVDGENVDKWLDVAKEQTTDTLKKQLSESKEIKKDEPQEKFKKVKFTLSEEQNEIVDHAIELASSALDSDKPGHLISMICQDFVATNMVERGDGEKYAFFDKFASMLGCEVIVVEGKKIVHGKKTLEKIVNCDSIVGTKEVDNDDQHSPDDRE